MTSPHFSQLVGWRQANHGFWWVVAREELQTRNNLQTNENWFAPTHQAICELDPPYVKNRV
jgi:hypothetical protein